MDHAAQCEPCTQKLLDYDSVDDSMKLLQPDIEKILAEAETRHQRPAFGDNPLVLLASLATVLLVCITAFYGLNSESSSSSSANLNRLTPKLKTSAIAEKTRAYPSNSLAVGSVKPVASFAKKHRATPDTSPFSPNFDVREQIQLPRIPSADDVTRQLEPLEPVLNYSTELPGLRTLQCSVNLTIEILRQTFIRPQFDENPDLGFWLESDLLAAV